jgi:hypothetical protein
MNKLYILVGLLFFNLAVLYGQVTVDYTNQFFVTQTAAKKNYFVFIYADGFIFIDSSNWEPVKILFNTETAQNGVFIAKNLFFNKIKESLYIYDLNILVRSANNGKRLDNCVALVDQKNNLNYVSVSGDDVRYTLNGDDSVYKYVEPAKNGDQRDPIKEPVTLTTNKAIKYIVYNPYSAEIDKRISDIGDRIKDKCENTEKNPKYSDVIKNTVESKPAARSSPDALYKALDDILWTQYGFDPDTFKQYKTYASMRGNEDIIRKNIAANASTLDKTDIEQLYTHLNDLEKLNIEGTENSYNEKTWNNTKAEIKRLTTMQNFNDPEQIDINSVRKLITHIEWRNNYKSNGNSWINRKNVTENAISKYSGKIKNYLVYRCRERIVNEITGQKLNFKFDPGYRDYCALSDKQAILNSIDTGTTISAADFTNIRYDASGGSPKFIQPLGNPPLAVINNKHIFVLRSKDNIYALDLNNPLQGTIQLKVRDSILYLLPGGINYQYAVTRNGGLKRYSIRGGTINEELMPQNSINENCTVLLDGDTPHVLSKDGIVDGNQSTSFMIKSTNSNGRWNFLLKDRKFTINSN